MATHLKNLLTHTVAKDELVMALEPYGFITGCWIDAMAHAWLAGWPTDLAVLLPDSMYSCMRYILCILHCVRSAQATQVINNFCRARKYIFEVQYFVFKTVVILVTSAGKSERESE